MKKWKKFLTCVLVVTMMIGLTACAGTAGQKKEGNTGEQGVRTFVDSAGREVQLPEKITKIAPSGMISQVILYSLCPDLLCGLAMEFPYYSMKYGEEHRDLPVFGQLYGNGDLNMETLMGAAPDVLIDMGEKKDTLKEDLDAVQEQMGIPVIFIEATLTTMPQAYQTLGELGFEPEQAEKLASYCEETLDYADEQAAKISEDEKKSVYLAMGNDGLMTTIQNSIHADVLEKTGAVNVVTADALSGRAGNISFEQLLVWQPDYILAESYQVYELIMESQLWQELDAVKNNCVYVIPYDPYSFINSPPSVNRMIGIWWLGNLLYPEYYPDAAEDKVQEYYQMFYHMDMNKDECKEVIEVQQPGA